MLNGKYYPGNYKSYWGISSIAFSFDSTQKRFNYSYETEPTSRRSSGTFKILGNLAILKSDTDINSLPFILECSKVDSLEHFKFIYHLGYNFPGGYKIISTLLVNDTIAYPLKNSGYETLNIQVHVKSFKVKFDTQKLYEDTMIENNGVLQRYHHNSYEKNIVFYTKESQANNNNLFQLNAYFTNNLFDYETFNSDTLDLKSSRVFIDKRYGTMFRKVK